jgi:transposase InsO family protein
MSLDIVVQRLLTDNGGANRSAPFAIAALDLGVSQRFTKPYRPLTNDKAERFICTLLTEWTYATAFGCSGWRTRALRPYLSSYNHDRRHRALNDQPHASRLPAVL